MLKEVKDICIDFDGTCVKHEYPEIGADIGAVPVLKRLVNRGYNLILFTMRSGKELDDAVNWFNENGIKLYGIQTNPRQKRWTDSPKAYGQLYIDDAGINVPTRRTEGQRPYVNWYEVEQILEETGLLEVM